MVKQRLLAGMESGGEIGIVQIRKGKPVIEYQLFRLAKNHRTLEYGSKDKETFTVNGEGILDRFSFQFLRVEVGKRKRRSWRLFDEYFVSFSSFLSSSFCTPLLEFPSAPLSSLSQILHSFNSLF